jgi:hypothetical protein
MKKISHYFWKIFFKAFKLCKKNIFKSVLRQMDHSVNKKIISGANEF